MLNQKEDFKMKTNQVMTRKMGVFDIYKRTSDSFFDANALLTQWNKTGGNTEKKMVRFLENENTLSFIDALKEDLAAGLCIDKENVSVVKKISARRCKGKNRVDQVWMHPYLFIKFAMWLNPKFEVQVIRFIYDELIKNRHLAGDNYNVLSSAIATLPDADYRQVAIAMQWIVFNRTGRELRQSATQEQLREISDLEHSLAFSINMGLVKTNEQLIMIMRKMYSDKYRKF